MKKELTRRSFLKLAGVGALAVAMSGSLTGCDVIDNLKDMDSVSAAIEDVKFMMSASAWSNGSNGKENNVDYRPTCEIRNNSKKAVTYGGSGSNCEVIITGVLTDKNGKEYPMTYAGENGSAPAGGKYEVKDFKLVAVGKGLHVEGSKVETTFKYQGKKAVFTEYNDGNITSKVE